MVFTVRHDFLKTICNSLLLYSNEVVQVLENTVKINIKKKPDTKELLLTLKVHILEMAEWKDSFLAPIARLYNIIHTFMGFFGYKTLASTCNIVNSCDVCVPVLLEV